MSGERIVIVDDNSARRNLVIKALEQGHYALNGLESDDLMCLKNSPSESSQNILPAQLLLISVRCIPDDAGFWDWLRKQAISLVILSAPQELARTAQFLAGGADDYLSDPFEPALVAARIRTCLKKVRLRQIDEWMSIMTHDSRAPVGLIVGWSQMFLDSWEENASIADLMPDAAKSMVDAGQFLLRYNDRNATWMGILTDEGGASKPYSIRAVSQDFSVWKDRTITIDIPEALLDYQADGLQEILTEILDNAVQFAPEETTPICLTVERANGPAREFFHFAISDSGIGISKEWQTRIFAPYVTILNKRGSGKRRDAGLGLAIAKAYLDAQDGKLWVESEPEKGSIFHFTIPVQPDYFSAS